MQDIDDNDLLRKSIKGLSEVFDGANRLELIVKVPEEELNIIIKKRISSEWKDQSYGRLTILGLNGFKLTLIKE